jgi:uncharacterized protein (DUF1697 family)
MADVRAALEEAGYEDAVTHLQTGNIVLATGERSAAKAEAALEKTMSACAGFDVDVMVRTAVQLERVLESNPLVGRDATGLAYGFLKSRPPAAAARALDGADFGPDVFALRGAEVYLHYPSGMGRSKMTGAWFERMLKTPMTVRNHNVVTRLAQLAREH